MNEAQFCIKMHGNRICHCSWWTGTNWSTWFYFARRYSAQDARQLVRQRFHRMSPAPLIRFWYAEQREQH